MTTILLLTMFVFFMIIGKRKWNSMIGEHEIMNTHHHQHHRILFILKRRQDYSVDLPNFNQKTVATGMYNSAAFVSEMLKEHHRHSKVVIVVDNNDIDREVHNYKPTHVIIEGLWVVPEKFKILTELHPKVKWVIRIHSELPFLSQEGVALSWLTKYLEHKHVHISANSQVTNDEIKFLVGPEKEHLVWFLPNYYPLKEDQWEESTAKPSWWARLTKPFIPCTDDLNIGCFGALRPLKNQLIQGMAALQFASSLGRKVNFHINISASNREDSILRNLDALFDAQQAIGSLVKHHWTDHPTFIKLVHDMDLSMQVSMSESFNIVSADSIQAGVPLVVSKEIGWAAPPYADCTSVASIVESMSYVYNHAEENVEDNRNRLINYSANSKQIWLARF